MRALSFVHESTGRSLYKGILFYDISVAEREKVGAAHIAIEILVL
jgi:hypothetical protein